MTIIPARVFLRYAERGSIEVLIEDFVYVRVNYDYRFTDNAHRLILAENIAATLTDAEVEWLPQVKNPVDAAP